jgi:hypothetical protein
MDWTFLLLLATAFIAGAINAVAGGGTLFSFTALGLNMNLQHANATNSALLTPASITSGLAFFGELRRHWRRFAILALPSAAGSWAGAVVLVSTSEDLFRRVVPFLILFAVLLFAFKDRLMILVRRARPQEGDAQHERIGLGAWVWGVTFQFVVAFYGGYFGAGIGILMISSFSLMGMRDMHEMNALKNPLAFLMNGAAAVKYALGGLVQWEYALPMAVCAIGGGLISARASRRINQTYLRRFVIVYGAIVSVYMFGRFWLGWFS